MSNELLVFLEPHAEQEITWVVRDADSRKVERQGLLEGAEQLKELKKLAGDTPCYLVVPATVTTQFLVTLPVNTREARDAIPYQLEDQLCNDIEELHFARGPMIEDKTYPVAVISKQQMQTWVGWIENAELQPQAMIIETLDIGTLDIKTSDIITSDIITRDTELLPKKTSEDKSISTDSERSNHQDTAIAALQWNNRVIVQERSFRSFGIDSESFQCWLKVAEKQFSSPLSLITGDSESFRIAGNQPDHIIKNSSVIAVNVNDANPAEFFSIASAINLLQGDYQLNDPLQRTLNLWRWPAIITLLLMLAYPGAVYWKNQQLQIQKNEVTEQINQLYRKTFPESQRIVNVRTQTEHRLKQLRKVNEGSPFIALLDQMLPALSLQPEVKIQSLDYTASKEQLQLSLRAPQNAFIDRFSQKLTELGVFNEIKTMRKRGQFTEGLLIVREKR